MQAIRFFTVFSFLLVFGLISGFSQNDFCFMTVSAQTTTETKPTETPQSKPVLVRKPTQRYRIGLQDVLDIVVAKHPELSLTSIKMDDKGKIRLPRINKLVTAACKTENELAAEIQELYKENYLRDPFVTVNVREQNSQPFGVMGAVKKPGYYVINRRVTLLELLSFAGGPDVEFAGTKIKVARVGGISGCVDESENEIEGEVTFFTFNLLEVIEQKTNPEMKPGDVVYMFDYERAFISGNVKENKSIPLKQNITLTQALIEAGGILPASKKDQITIYRQDSKGGNKQTLVLNLNDIYSKKIEDPILQPNDVINVPKDGVKSATNNFIDALLKGIPNIFFRF